MESNKSTKNFVPKKTKGKNIYKAWLLLEGRAGDERQVGLQQGGEGGSEAGARGGGKGRCEGKGWGC